MTRYGPHDEASAPKELEILPDHKWPSPVTVPIPTRIMAQRRQVNDMAHHGETDQIRRPNPTPQAAAAARDQAMEAVRTTPEWKDAARRALWHLATTRPTFTADDVWAELERRGVPSPEEPRALGPVVFKALRAGAIRDTGRMVRSTRRHSTKMTVYERNPQ